LPAIDPLVAVELANSHVVPAATAQDRSRALQHLVSDGAALHIDVAGVLTGITPLGNHPVHRVVPPGDKAVQRHRHVPDHAAHRSPPLCVSWSWHLLTERPARSHIFADRKSTR